MTTLDLTIREVLGAVTWRYLPFSLMVPALEQLLWWVLSFLIIQIWAFYCYRPRIRVKDQTSLRTHSWMRIFISAFIYVLPVTFTPHVEICWKETSETNLIDFDDIVIVVNDKIMRVVQLHIWLRESTTVWEICILWVQHVRAFSNLFQAAAL